MKPVLVTAIGTCRIHQPLRGASNAYSLRIGSGRTYGYTHSSAEALQLVRYFLGRETFSSDEGFCIFRPSFKVETSLPVVSSDFYLVEISSAKRIQWGGRYLQINYLYKAFEDFFSDTQRTRTYWALARPGRALQLRTFLQQDAVFNTYSESMQDFLASIVLSTATKSEMAQDMQNIADLLGREKVVFVTHVNARTPTGQTIESRENLIDDVLEISREMGLPCLDPTDAMVAFGQQKAMQRDGQDLTHYTDEFSAYLWRQWYDTCLSRWLPMPDGHLTSPALSEEVQRQLEALLRQHQYLDAQEQLSQLPAALQQSVLVLQLKAEVAAGLQHYDQVADLIFAAELQTGPTPRGTRILMRALAGQAQWAACGHLAASLMADEVEDMEVLRMAALSQHHLGQHASAVRLGLKLLKNAPEDLQLLSVVMQSLAFGGGPDGFVQAFMLGCRVRLDGWFELALQTAQSRCDVRLVQEVITAWMDADAEQALIGLGKGCVDIWKVQAATSIGQVLTSWTDLAQSLAKRWADAAQQGLDSGALESLGLAYEQACAAAVLTGGRDHRRLRVEIGRQWKQRLNLAHQERDDSATLRLLENANQLLQDQPSVVGRCVVRLWSAGRVPQALQLLMPYLTSHPQDHALRLRALRLTLRLDQPALACEAMVSLWPALDLEDGPYAQEWATLLPLCVKRLTQWVRQLAHQGDFDQAWRVAQRYPVDDVEAIGRAQSYTVSFYLRALKQLDAQTAPDLGSVLKASNSLLEARIDLLQRVTRIAQRTGQTVLLIPLWLHHLGAGTCDEALSRKAIKLLETSKPAHQVLADLLLLPRESCINQEVVLQIERLKTRSLRACRVEVSECLARGDFAQAHWLAAQPGCDGLLSLLDLNARVLLPATCDADGVCDERETVQAHQPSYGAPDRNSLGRALAELQCTANCNQPTGMLPQVKALGEQLAALTERAEAIKRPWVAAFQSLSAALIGSTHVEQHAELIMLVDAAHGLREDSATRRGKLLAQRLLVQVFRSFRKTRQFDPCGDLIFAWLQEPGVNDQSIGGRFDLALQQIPPATLIPQVCLWLSQVGTPSHWLERCVVQVLNLPDQCQALSWAMVMLHLYKEKTGVEVWSETLTAALDSTVRNVLVQGHFEGAANAIDAPALRANGHHADWNGHLLSYMETCLKQATESSDLEMVTCAGRMLFLEPGHALALDVMCNPRNKLTGPVSAVYQRIQHEQIVSRLAATEVNADSSSCIVRLDPQNA
jgi:Vi polysaccharide biosynthesis protein TviD